MTDYGFSFCEHAQASPQSRWHIRRLTAVGKKLGGGADTSALCGRVVAQDLESEVQEPSQRVCSGCVKKWWARLMTVNLNEEVVNDK